MQEWNRGLGQRRACRTGRGTIGRRLGTGGAGGVVAIAVLIALAPSGLGARSHSTLKPAYAGTTSQSDGGTYYNCGSASAPVAKWTPSTGALTSSAAASFSTCSYNLFGSESASADSGASIYLPFSVSTASVYNVTTSFSWKAVDKTAISAGTCPTPSSNFFYNNNNTCSYDVIWIFEAYTWIYDLTTNSVVSASDGAWELVNSSTLINYAYCTFGFCGSGGTTYNGSSGYNSVYDSPYGDLFSYYVGPGTQSGKASFWANSTSWDPTYMSGSNITLYPSNSYADEIWAGSAAYAYVDGTSDSTYIYGGTTTSSFNPPGTGSASISTSLKFTSIDIAVG